MIQSAANVSPAQSYYHANNATIWDALPAMMEKNQSMESADEFHNQLNSIILI